jgi:hypothetical protein
MVLILRRRVGGGLRASTSIAFRPLLRTFLDVVILMHGSLVDDAYRDLKKNTHMVCR